MLIEFKKIQAVFVVYRKMSSKYGFFKCDISALAGYSHVLTLFILPKLCDTGVLTNFKTRSYIGDEFHRIELGLIVEG